MGFGDAVKHVLNNYVNFQGRALRSEFWYWALFSTIAQFVAKLGDRALFDHQVLEYLLLVITFAPWLAVGTRRLHDTERSGWWQLIWFIPIIGTIVLIVWLATEGTWGANRFGPPAPTSA